MTDEAKKEYNKWDVMQPKSTAERIAVAKAWMDDLKPESPYYCDPIDNNARFAFEAVPERLYVVEGGKIVYRGGEGPVRSRRRFLLLPNFPPFVPSVRAYSSFCLAISACPLVLAWEQFGYKTEEVGSWLAKRFPEITPPPPKPGASGRGGIAVYSALCVGAVAVAAGLAYMHHSSAAASASP